MNGSLVSLGKTVKLGDETVTLQTFFASYTGTYLILTARAKGGRPPVVPEVTAAQGNVAVQGVTPLSNDAVAAWISLPVVLANFNTAGGGIGIRLMGKSAIPLALTLGRGPSGGPPVSSSAQEVPVGPP